MAKATHTKMLRKFGGHKEDGTKIAPSDVPVGEHKSVPMKFGKSLLVVRIAPNQRINPAKEYMRQLGVNRKRLKKLRAKQKKQAKLQAKEDNNHET